MRISKNPHFTEEVKEGCPDKTLACPLCGTESKVQWINSYECVNLQCYGCGSMDTLDGFSQSPGCKRIVALLQDTPPSMAEIVGE